MPTEREEEPGVARLGRWLTEKGIPSIGPGMAMQLLRIADRVALEAEGEEDRRVRVLASAYARSLGLVCTVLAFHQGTVLEHLDALIGQRGDLTQ